MKNPRRAYDKDGNEYPPMLLGNLREHGCRNVDVECLSCGRNASVNVDILDDAVPVPDVAMEMPALVCSACGARGEKLYIRPDWSGRRAAGMGRT